MAREPATRHTVAGYLPLILSAAGALGVTPFAVMRWMTGDWLIATVDTIIVAGFVLLGTYIYHTRKVRLASIAVAILCVAGALVTVYVRGPQQIFWTYPALMASFYLLKPREAIALTLSMTAFLIPELMKNVSAFGASTIIISILVTTSFAFAFSVVNNRQHDKLRHLATKDPLTGAGNRRALLAKLTEVIASFDRNQAPSSLVLLDIDHFKAVNDKHGHTAGDEILQRIAQIVELRIRLNDTLYRIGGEEFVVVVDGQGIEAASRLAEQLRTLIEANELLPDRTVTISLGVAELQSGETHDDWVHRADQALYRAKRAGRNTYKLAS
jgi:diguanylate cyclase (GGDEF)-like protein